MPPSSEKSPGLRLPLAGGWYASFMQSMRAGVAAPYIGIFLLIFAVLKFNQYLFFHFNTNPAVILLPTGISLAFVYLFGYRTVIPITAAWAVSLLTNPAHPPLLIAVTAALAYALQSLVGGYALHYLGFQGAMGRVRCALVFICTALVVSAIAPGITTWMQWLTEELPTPVWVTLSRAWAGGVMSIMVFTPLITTWWLKERTQAVRRHAAMESAFGLATIVVVTYLTFWTALARGYSFIFLYLLFATLFWIGLRMRPHIMAAALFVVALLAVAGSIIARPNVSTALNQQLLGIELFIIILAPILYILAALVDERRTGIATAELRAQELEKANRRLSLKDQTRNDFLATLAHELRNPLAPVVSSLELMRIKARSSGDTELKQLIDTAEIHSWTLTRLLDDLLDISRISRKKFRIKKEVVQLRSIIDQALRTVDALYKTRKQTLVTSIPEEVVWVEVDPLRFEQALVNILNNAAKYTPSGGRIELAVSREAEKGLRVSVKDNGKGIEPHLLNKIFDPFMQAHGEAGAGLGIGLALTKRLIELHGGEIWAESKGLGKGSTFTIMLPPQSLVVSLVSFPERRRRGPRTEPHKKSKRAFTILVVDDNKAAADALGRLLKHSGHTVLTAYDGPSALKKLRGGVVDVVLLDIGLPGMDGYAVARNMRQEYGERSPLLVALTGYGQEEDKAEAKEAGFQYHLTKPVGLADIEAVLTKDPSALPL